MGLIVLTLNSAAYQTNILIGAIRNLPQGQLEGAHSIGMNPRQTYRKILFPQAIRTSWPALANEGILLLKASALVSTITVLDLMGHARTVFSRSYDLWVYGGAALLVYFAYCFDDPCCFLNPSLLVPKSSLRSLVQGILALGANSYKQPSPRPHRPQEHRLLLHHAHAERYLEHPKGNLPTHLRCPCRQTHA